MTTCEKVEAILFQNNPSDYFIVPESKREIADYIHQCQTYLGGVEYALNLPDYKNVRVEIRMSAASEFNVWLSQEKDGGRWTLAATGFSENDLAKGIIRLLRMRIEEEQEFQRTVRRHSYLRYANSEGDIKEFGLPRAVDTARRSL